MLSVFASESSRARRGKTAADDRALRLERMRWALLVGSGVLTVDEAARAAGVNRTTIWRWRTEAETYDDAEAEGLRRLTDDRA